MKRLQPSGPEIEQPARRASGTSDRRSLFLLLRSLSPTTLPGWVRNFVSFNPFITKKTVGFVGWQFWSSHLLIPYDLWMNLIWSIIYCLNQEQKYHNHPSIFCYHHNKQNDNKYLLSLQFAWNPEYVAEPSVVKCTVKVFPELIISGKVLTFFSPFSFSNVSSSVSIT